ncbi:MAG: hypothetical protein PHQ19_05450, partial [Candidatus Krumholzibacteria bacterium]|nr:hypothetical protein [Candidatus Krumholzibacteria bacterium]
TWQAPTGGSSDGDWTISGDNQYSAVSGNVGIGTTTPGSKLTVFSGGTQTIYARGTDAATIGVVGYNQSSGNEGRLGTTEAGMYGRHGSTGNFGYVGGASLGVFGRNGTSLNYGQLGAVMYGVYGRNGNGNEGYLGGADMGAYGYHNATANSGTLGSDSAGVYGVTAQDSRGGVYGRGTAYQSVGVQGVHAGSGNYGQLGTHLGGVYGYNAVTQNYGQLGADFCGVYGYNRNGCSGRLGDDIAGVYADASSIYDGKYGVVAFNRTTVSYLSGDNVGVHGASVGGGKGVEGSSGEGFGVEGSSTNGIGVRGVSSYGNGVYGWSNTGYGIYGESLSNYAGYFQGDVHVAGTLSKTAGSFVIDHPLDPENRILRHMFVESPENLCLYRGKVTLDASGEAVVALPSYFAALTKEEEATVSLTPVGRPFLAGYEWLSDYMAFKVYGEPGREVSWLACADRDDPAIRTLARPVEEDKGPDSGLCERGRLLNP